ncbi:phosphatase PAP2 family protein [Sphingomonas sp. NCPPB 2930]
MERFSNKGPGLGLVTAACGLVLLAWDATGLDLPLAQVFGGPAGFPLQDHWLLTRVLHSGARNLAWVVVAWLWVGVWRPMGGLRRIPFGRRLQWAVTTLAAVAAVSLLKATSTTSCPWSLEDFGGIAHYRSHWANLFGSDGGSGGCFPAGHASTGFAFVGGYFAYRGSEPGRARAWLVGGLTAGLVLGLTQQMRGAHFMSHTLWSGWVCWCVAWGIDAVARRIRDRRTPACGAVAHAAGTAPPAAAGGR